MTNRWTVALSAFLVGALTVQGLHAQAKPPAYTIAEIDVTNPDAFAKEIAPIGGKALQDAGAKFLARGGKAVAIEGEPPKSRVTVHVWESIDKAHAGFTSDAYKEARKFGDKYAKFRVFAVEGVAP